jgi:hypothetical protein
VAQQAARLIAALLLAAFAWGAGAQPTAPDRLKTPQTPWSALAPEERRILGPIEAEWDRMPGYQQQRLVASARRYPSFQPIQKERFDARIRDWARMSPEQRREARETFQGLRKLPPERQHELRQRWLERHRPGEESSEPNFERDQRSRDYQQRREQRSSRPPPQGR